jgi:hypothetical protein
MLDFGGQQVEATQSSWFVLTGLAQAAVAFADGRPFHTLDLASGCAAVVHDCPPDDYQGRYCVADPNRWTLTWRIQGPRKNLRITTRYSRA